MSVSAINSVAASNAALLASAVQIPASAAIAATTESSGQIQSQLVQLEQQQQSSPTGQVEQDIQLLQQAQTLQLNQGPTGLNAKA